MLSRRNLYERNFLYLLRWIWKHPRYVSNCFTWENFSILKRRKFSVKTKPRTMRDPTVISENVNLYNTCLIIHYFTVNCVRACFHACVNVYVVWVWLHTGVVSHLIQSVTVIDILLICCIVVLIPRLDTKLQSYVFRRGSGPYCLCWPEAGRGEGGISIFRSLKRLHVKVRLHWAKVNTSDIASKQVLQLTQGNPLEANVSFSDGLLVKEVFL